MKIIPISKGCFAMVDDEDYDLLSEHSWRLEVGKNTSHAARTGKHDDGRGRTIYMHHVVLPLQNGLEVDHIDGNGLNNQKSNLRLATRSQNKANQKKHWKGTSKYKGVSWCTRDERWTVRIKCIGKSKNLGSFTNEKEAARCYDAAAKKAFGEFANLNFK